MLTIKTNVNSNEVINKIKTHQKIEFEDYSNWIPAGSGNFERTKTDGRYRSNCNTFRDTITCETHLIKSLKLVFNHCNKLDCKTCFIHASSKRARSINEKILEFKAEAKKHGIKTGNILHIVFSPRKSLALRKMGDYNEFLEFRRNEIFTMLKECGIFAGVIFTQLWSYKCQVCGKEEDNCNCQEKELERKLNPHFHVLGYGYLTSTEEFREYFKDWVYVNLGRRKDAFHTIFYILTNVALWRKADGKLKPAYQSFGYLKSSEFVKVGERIKFVNDRCPTCKNPRKRVVTGVEVHVAPEEVKDSMIFINRGKNQTILTEKYHSKEIGESFKHNQNQTYIIQVSEINLIFGHEIKYKRVLREYKLLDVNGLREITMKNKTQYRRDKKKWKMEEKESNGYG